MLRILWPSQLSGAEARIAHLKLLKILLIRMWWSIEVCVSGYVPVLSSCLKVPEGLCVVIFQAGLQDAVDPFPFCLPGFAFALLIRTGSYNICLVINCLSMPKEPLLLAEHLQDGWVNPELGSTFLGCSRGYVPWVNPWLTRGHPCHGHCDFSMT